IGLTGDVFAHRGGAAADLPRYLVHSPEACNGGATLSQLGDLAMRNASLLRPTAQGAVRWWSAAGVDGGLSEPVVADLGADLLDRDSRGQPGQAPAGFLRLGDTCSRRSRDSNLHAVEADSFLRHGFRSRFR